MPVVPPALFCPESPLQPGIIKVALGFSSPLDRLAIERRAVALERKCPSMKPIRIVLSPTRSRHVNLFLGLVLLLVSLLLFLALATWHASDPSLNTATDQAGPGAVHNWVGLFGSYLSDLMLQSLGLTAFLLPLWLGGIGWTWMRSRPSGSVLLRWMGTLLALTFMPAVFGLMPWHWRWMHLLPVEGVAGRLVAGLLVVYLNIQGAWLVAGVLAAAGLYFASAISLWVVREAAENYWLHIRSWLDRWKNWREERAELKEERRLEHEDLRSEESGPAHTLQFAPAIPATNPEAEPEEEVPHRSFLARLFRRRKRAPESDPLDEIPAFRRAPLEQSSPVETNPARASRQQADEEIPIAPQVRRSSIWETAEAAAAQPAGAANVSQAVPQNVVPMQPAPSRFVDTRAVEPRPVASPFEPAPTPAPAPVPAGEIAIHGRADADVRTVTVAPKNVSGFKLPSSTLLNAGEGPQTVREDELREEAKVLVEKCAEFDVRGQVVQINPGPMVTTYEFKPEAGVKYSRVTGLADDLCLAMRAESILIERMAGKSTVGIQVPNHERETIHLRDVLESETFAKAKSRLTLAMGKDINGRIVTADLNVMPHVLIAGSTGSGKSVAINAMIMSLLFRTTPAQVRLILVDPKRVELGMYEGIPHLFTPIITEPKLAANALRNAVREMERRLKLLASRSVRNIDQYNKLFEGVMPSLFDEGDQEEPLPYIVIIIDELADLMMLDRSNVEESITRLAQMARAVGIHLILATQRPSVDVITGLIKANVPTRISFRLATKVDSRTILDTNGAEALLGRGDMLFLPPGTSRLMRLHAPYVSEKETAAVVAFWKDQGQAEYVEGFLESPKDERVSVDGSNPDPDENDPMFDDAVRLVFEFGKASTSLLQRRLRIGYGRAAHLIDLMERDGLVGPADGSRPRELLKAPGWLHEVMASNE
jgi:S-DNA-T family DNA segregation ATPase FtsK/SpoIIIE